MANDRRQRGSSLAINTLHSRITPELCDFLTSLRRCVVEGEQFIQHRLKARLLASRRHAARGWSSSIGVDSLTATKTTCGSSMFRATEASVRWAGLRADERQCQVAGLRADERKCGLCVRAT